VKHFPLTVCCPWLLVMGMRHSAAASHTLAYLDRYQGDPMYGQRPPGYARGGTPMHGQDWSYRGNPGAPLHFASAEMLVASCWSLSELVQQAWHRACRRSRGRPCSRATPCHTIPCRGIHRCLPPGMIHLVHSRRTRVGIHIAPLSLMNAYMIGPLQAVSTGQLNMRVAMMLQA
jgi:hypothetical protein